MPADGQPPAGSIIIYRHFSYGEHAMSDSTVNTNAPDYDFVKLVIAVTKTKFPLGQILMTANAAAQLDAVTVIESVNRHAMGDWGEVCPEDAAQNELALKEGCRLLSVYGNGERRFWIITEADRSVTTVLMPSDY
jgi:hypothetical protein